LERDQVNQLLTDTDFSTPEGTPPTDEELDFIMAVGDREGMEAIPRKEFEPALQSWKTYITMKDKYEAVLEKYDTSKTGKLELEELRAYLTDLNHGKEVSLKTAEWVMKEADVMGDGAIRKQEIFRATASWYSYVEENQQSACCVIA